jgi:hypothetical protein
MACSLPVFTPEAVPACDPLFQCADPLLELVPAGDTGRGKERECNSARNIG